MPESVEQTMGTAGHEAAATARARAGVYELLATMFRAPLCAGSLRRLRSEDFLQAMVGAGMRLDDGFKSGDENALMESLAVDFTQLFHGPRQHRVAVESIQTGNGESTLNGVASVTVQEFYRATGLCLNESQPELPDHISVELAAMAALARAEAEAHDAGDGPEAHRRARQQAEFLASHPGCWGPDLGRWVELQADTSFYREAGRLLANFLQADAAELARAARVPVREEQTVTTPSDGEHSHA